MSPFTRTGRPSTLPKYVNVALGHTEERAHRFADQAATDTSLPIRLNERTQISQEKFPALYQGGKWRCGAGNTFFLMHLLRERGLGGTVSCPVAKLVWTQATHRAAVDAPRP